METIATASDSGVSCAPKARPRSSGTPRASKVAAVDRRDVDRDGRVVGRYLPTFDVDPVLAEAQTQWHAAGTPYGTYAGQRADPRYGSIEELIGVLAGVVEQVQIHCVSQEAVGIEPQVHLGRRLHAAHHQCRADEQHDADRDLHHDEGASKSVLAAGPLAFTRAVLERSDQVGSGAAERRREAEDQAGGYRQGEGEGDDSAVHREVPTHGNRAWRPETQQQPAQPDCQADTTDPAEKREHQALGKQLAHEARFAGAKGQTNGDLAASRRRSRQGHRSDVRTGADQYETDHAEQEGRDRGQIAVGHRVDAHAGGRQHTGSPSFIDVGVLDCKPREDRVHLCLHLCHAGTLGETPLEHHPTATALFGARVSRRSLIGQDAERVDLFGHRSREPQLSVELRGRGR